MPGVVHQHIDLAGTAQHGGDDRIERLRLREIGGNGLHRARLVVHVRGQRGEPGLVAIHRCHIDAGAKQSERHGAPDAARRTRHDRDLLLARHGRLLRIDWMWRLSRALARRATRRTGYAGTSDATGLATACGSHTLTVVPIPSSLSIDSCPRWRLTMCLTMARPSPVPPAARERPVSTR